jgi:hypothetical protein
LPPPSSFDRPSHLVQSLTVRRFCHDNFSTTTTSILTSWSVFSQALSNHSQPSHPSTLFQTQPPPTPSPSTCLQYSRTSPLPSLALSFQSPNCLSTSWSGSLDWRDPNEDRMYFWIGSGSSAGMRGGRWGSRRRKGHSDWRRVRDLLLERRRGRVDQRGLQGLPVRTITRKANDRLSFL